MKPGQGFELTGSLDAQFNEQEEELAVSLKLIVVAHATRLFFCCSDR